MNAYTGEFEVEIQGQRLTVVYDWRALAAIRSELGMTGAELALGGGDLLALAKLIAIGLKRHHPEWTAELVLDASPPVTPVIEVIGAAMTAAYFGPGGAPPDSAETEGNPRVPSLTRLKTGWRRLTGRA